MGKAPSGQYGEVISLAIQKFASRLPRQDKQDLEQEAALALFEAGDVPKKLAYRIVERRIIDWLRKQPPRTENIDDPDVLRKYEKQSVHFPDLDGKIDAERAKKFVKSLPPNERDVLTLSFGLGSLPPFTDKEIAFGLGESEDWVVRKRKQALFKLRAIMEKRD